MLNSDFIFIIQFEQSERFLTEGYIALTFEIQLEDETCRDFIEDKENGIEIEQADSVPVRLSDYFGATMTPNKAKARVKVKKSPDPDTIEYFRAFTLKFRIVFDASRKDCVSEGGLQMTLFDSNDNSPVFEESTKTLKEEENLEK